MYITGHRTPATGYKLIPATRWYSHGYGILLDVGEPSVIGGYYARCPSDTGYQMLDTGYHSRHIDTRHITQH